MKSCSIISCLSNENTKVNERKIAFFAFPKDANKRKKWLQICKLDDVSNDTRYICELHFDKMSFTLSGELKINAVPFIVNTFEDSKEVKNNADQELILKTQPIKKAKIDYNSDAVSENQSLLLADDCSSKVISLEDTKSEPNNTLNKPQSESLNENFQKNKKIYRLIINIDKIKAKPAPRCRKFKNFKIRSEIFSCQNGCKLKEALLESKLAYQCKKCNKYYTTRHIMNLEDKVYRCHTCQKIFSSQQALITHSKKHYTCCMCDMEFDFEILYENHMKLHINNDKLYSYKCNLCPELFITQEEVKKHCSAIHPMRKPKNAISLAAVSSMGKHLQQNDFRCTPCNIIFRREQTFIKHMNSHKQKAGLRCNVKDVNNIIPVPDPITGSQIGILRAVKFTCRVCSEEFDNVGEVDKHTRTHLEASDEKNQCNICFKEFETNTLLNEHLKHHLSRAHACPICSKAFINRTTLKIHLKTHADVPTLD